jgi:gamma-glutamylcyclotransferase (GGCT)/AIG2-like uncharacterized protein YtfP
MTDNCLVFVYGTLRRGEHFHQLLAGARYLGTHTTPPAYTMVHLGSYPGVIATGSSCIAGEVYAVDQQTLRRLDELEHCPRHYDRARIATPFGAAWVYLYRECTGDEPVIDSGDWINR